MKLLVVALFATLCLASMAANFKVSSFTFFIKVSPHPCVVDASCGIHDYRRTHLTQISESHKVTMWLRQNNFAARCGSMLMDVSTPSSPKYGQHLSMAQLRELVYDAEAVDAVHAFLDKHKVVDRFEAPNGDYISFRAPIATVQNMFRTKFFTFASAQRSHSLNRALSMTIPDEIASFVSTTTGVIDFPMHAHHASIEAFTADSLKRQTRPGVNPALIAKTYAMPNETDSSTKSDIAVFESLGQSYSPADLDKFLQMFNIPAEKLANVIGPNDPSECLTNPNNCAEANLDVQYLVGVAQGAPVTYWSIPTSVGHIFLEFAEEIAKASNPPLVYSISYGGAEQYQNESDMEAFNAELCKLGLRGMSVFVSSGDDGVAGNALRQDPDACAYVPQYPANCPYITTVGATMGPEAGLAEVVCTSDKTGGTNSIITSGSGFSSFFSMPDYQSDVVNFWLANGSHVPPKSQFSSNGRAYPDVSALGNAYTVVIGGQVYQVSGTSASTPVFCAMIALINGDRDVRGKKPLGFLNPLLYSMPSSIFIDITVGKNNCSAGGPRANCCDQGFVAGPGWDAASGFGSIHFESLANYLADLP